LKKKTKSLKTYCACPSKHIVKLSTSGKKGILSCCKRLFEKIGANLAHTQAEILYNVQNMHFWQKAPGVDGLMKFPHMSLHCMVFPYQHKENKYGILVRMFTMPQRNSFSTHTS